MAEMTIPGIVIINNGKPTIETAANTVAGIKNPKPKPPSNSIGIYPLPYNLFMYIIYNTFIYVN